MADSRSSTRKQRTTTYTAIVGQTLAQYRVAAGLSQAAIAAKLGLAQSVVSRIEKGSLPLAVDLLGRWSADLGVRPWQVLQRADQGASALRRQGVRVLLARVKAHEDGAALIGAAAVGAMIGLAFAKRVPED